MSDNVYLIGYRSTGKSSVARKVAELLGPPWKSFDIDEGIEHAAGLSTTEIFKTLGEPHFRDLESQQLIAADRIGKLVVATGGGTIEREANRALLAKGKVVWLRASAETLLARANADPLSATRRPALTNLDPLTEIKTMLARRTPLYQGLSQLTIDVDEHGIDDVVPMVLGFIRA